MGLAFTCTQHFAVHHIKKENSLMDSAPSATPPSFPFPSNKLCKSMCICVSPAKQTEHDSQIINKVLMSVRALSGNHANKEALQSDSDTFFFSSLFHVK